MEEKKEASDKKKERDFGTCPLSPFQLTRYTSVIKSLCLQAGLAVIWEALSLFKCHWRYGDAEHSYNELALIGVGGRVIQFTSKIFPSLLMAKTDQSVL